MSLRFQPCQLKKGGFRRIDITWMPEIFAENRGSPTKTGRLEFVLTSTAHFIKAVTPPQNDTIEEFTNCPAL